MTKFMYKELEAMIDRLINESPLTDCFGNNFIVLNFAFLRCFYKSFNKRPIVMYEGEVSVQSIYNYMSYLTARTLKYNVNPIKVNPRLTEDLYKELVTKIIDVYNYMYYYGARKASQFPMIYLLRKSSSKAFDLDSAVKSLMRLIDVDPQNKYLFPLYMAQPMSGSKRVSRIKVFDFMGNFEEDKKFIMETDKKFTSKINAAAPKLDNDKLVEDTIVVDKPMVNKPRPTVVQKETVVKQDIDKKVVLDDNMTLKEVGELCQYITDAINFLESQGINWRSKIKVKFNKESRIDDSCGYPVIINDEDFLDPLPFPDEVVGDQKLANL